MRLTKQRRNAVGQDMPRDGRSQNTDIESRTMPAQDDKDIPHKQNGHSTHALCPSQMLSAHY